MSHIDNVRTRFPNGVNNHGDADLFQGLPVMDQRLAHEYFEDFDAYIPSINSWVQTGVGLSVVATAADGGIIRLNAASGEIAQIQRGTGNFTLELGKRLWFSGRVAFQTPATDVSLFALANANSDLASNFTNGLRVLVANAGTALAYSYAEAGNVTTNIVDTTLVADTFIDVEMFWDGVDQIIFALDGVIQTSITISTLTAIVLTPGFVSVPSSGTGYMDVDYTMVVKER